VVEVDVEVGGVVTGVVAGMVVGDVVGVEGPAPIQICVRPRSRWWDGGFVVGLSGGGSFVEAKGDGGLYGGVWSLW